MDDDKLLLHALEYAAQGWPVFPCNATKNPLNAGGFLNATTNPETIREWWERWPAANIGFSPGSVGMMVVDIDPGAKMEEIHAAVGGLPDTGLRATTPRGGSHRYYALAEGEEVPPIHPQDRPQCRCAKLRLLRPVAPLLCGRPVQGHRRPLHVGQLAPTQAGLSHARHGQGGGGERATDQATPTDGSSTPICPRTSGQQSSI